MPHWAVKHGVQTLIAVLIAALISGIGYVAWHVCKIPGLEDRLKAHDDKLATISANLIILMSKSGRLEKDQLKGLLSRIKEIGNAKAGFVAGAKVLEGSGTVPLANWVPVDQVSTFMISMEKGRTVCDKKEIAAMISSAAIAHGGATWSIENNDLIAAYGGAKVAFTPEKKAYQKLLEKWVIELNNLSSAAAEIKKAGEEKKE